MAFRRSSASRLRQELHGARLHCPSHRNAPVPGQENDRDRNSHLQLRCRSSPLKPGISTSRMTQEGAAVARDRSLRRAKARFESPGSQRPSGFANGSVSSTTHTGGIVVFILLVLVVAGLLVQQNRTLGPRGSGSSRIPRAIIEAQRGIYGRKKGLLAEGLEKAVDGAIRHHPGADCLVPVGRDEHDWHRRGPRNQLPLKFRPSSTEPNI